MKLKRIINLGLVFFACMQAYAFASETRMDALGGISIAVFDKEQEALDNPARLPYIPRVTIVAKGVSAERKNTSVEKAENNWETQYSWSDTHIGKTTSTLENINKSNEQQGTLLCFIPLLNMGFLGGIEYDSNSSLYQYKDIGYSYDRYTSKSTISYDPSVYVAGFGMRLDRLSFGAGARITSEDPVKRYSESMYSYSWDSFSSTYQMRIDGIQYKGGIAYVGDVMEFDAFGTYQPYTLEERILSRTQYGGTVVTDYGRKNPNTSTGTITAATARTRFKVSDATTIGLLASYSVQKIDSSNEHSNTSFYNSSYYSYSSTRTSSWNSKNNNEYGGRVCQDHF